MNRRKRIIIISSALVILVTLLIAFTGKEEGNQDIKTTVKRGPFQINVFTTGELEARNSVSINGPEGLRSAGIWQVKIADIVSEGTVVKKGDYIAALDKTELANKLKDAESELQKSESQFNQNTLDTALSLRQARDELINLHFTTKEKEIVLEQSQYEPPATIRQAELDLDRSKRAYDQAVINYKLKERQARAKMQEAGATLMQARNRYQRLADLLGEFTITAPEDGMVIYQREWNGRKRTVGSTVGAWDPTVATLPDLSLMISKTYVNEVDIRKVKMGQKVQIGLDAFPEKRLTGVVTSVANVGEQSPKNDAKVFEVQIQVNEKDTSLRPAMTTGNNILVGFEPDKLFIPLEAVHSQGDSLTFVYMDKTLGLVRQEVVTGTSNDNFTVIEKGLEEGDEVFLSIPEKGEELDLISLPKEI